MCMLLFVACTPICLEGSLMPLGVMVKGWVQIRTGQDEWQNLCVFSCGLDSSYYDAVLKL